MEPHLAEAVAALLPESSMSFPAKFFQLLRLALAVLP
jgi:hypothetical protein